MPNVLAHNFVTHEVMAVVTPNLALGSVLPDFVGMYRDYEGGSINLKKFKRRTLGLGIYLHYRTDEVFDAQPEKPKVTTDLTAHLAAVGIKPDAARLSAHLLADLMLDGALAEQPEPRASFSVLADYILDGETRLHTRKFPAEFTKFVEDYFEKSQPKNYSDPEKLALITQDRLNHRARTYKARVENTIERAQLPTLAEVIDIQGDRIRRLGTAALTRTIHTLESQLDVGV